MKHRVVILTEIIAPYRIPVFNALARHAELDFARAVYGGDRQGAAAVAHPWPMRYRFSYEVLPSWRWRVGKSGVW